MSLTMRTWAALAVVAAVVAIQSGAFLRRVAESHAPSALPMDGSAHERRLAPVREALRGTEAVGYLFPRAPDAALADAVQAAYFFRSQYALAPIRLKKNADEDLVLADLEALAHARAVFEPPSDGEMDFVSDGGTMILLPPSQAPLLAQLSLVGEFEGGILLFRRTGR